MIPRRRLLATTLLAAAAAGVPVRAAAQPSLPADPDGTIPDTLTARGGAGLLEPGFPIGHLAVSGAAGGVRFRTAAGWGPWQPVVAGCTGRTDRAAALLPAGGALGVELDPRPRPSVRSTSRTPWRRASATSAATCSSTSRAVCTRAAGREPTRSRCSGRAADAR